MNIKFLILILSCCFVSISFADKCKIRKDYQAHAAMFTVTCSIGTTRDYIDHNLNTLKNQENLVKCQVFGSNMTGLRYKCQSNKYITVYCGDNGSGVLKDNKCQKNDSQPTQGPMGEIFTGAPKVAPGDVFK